MGNAQIHDKKSHGDGIRVIRPISNILCHFFGGGGVQTRFCKSYYFQSDNHKQILSSALLVPSPLEPFKLLFVSADYRGRRGLHANANLMAGCSEAGAVWWRG